MLRRVKASKSNTSKIRNIRSKLRKASCFLLFIVIVSAFYLISTRISEHGTMVVPSKVGGPGNTKVAALVVGTGLAGLTAAYELLSKYNQSVILVEKTAKVGGNSAKASSGINGAGLDQQIKVLTELQKAHKDVVFDSIELFKQDTVKSATNGILVGPDRKTLPHDNVDDRYYSEELVDKLVGNSKAAIEWLTTDLGLSLNKVSQLGGHSVARTHRGEKLPPGFEIISTLNKALEKFTRASEEGPTLQILKNTSVTKLLREGNRIVGFDYKEHNEEDQNEEVKTLYGPVVLATGGFAADFGVSSLLSKYRPDLLGLPSTNGPQSTGDGHKLVEQAGGLLRNMEQIQIHPTGFVNPKDPSSKWKILAGEALRGTGGLLLDIRTGKRFVNELNTRDRVSTAIFDLFDKNRKFSLDANDPTTTRVVMILNEASYKEMKMNFGFYMKMGLIHKVTLQELSDTVLKNQSSRDLLEELASINKLITGQFADPFGRTLFASEPYDLSQGTESFVYYGYVTPVIHFTMGGVQIDADARVLTRQNKAFQGLYAAGEVTGGIHGKNRLGGSSLLECVVFGKIAANLLASDLQSALL